MKSTDLDELCHRSADACGREPIHLPGAIQPHGILVGLCPKSLGLVTRSANVDAIFGPQPQLKTPPWLPPEAATACRELGPARGVERTFITGVPGIGPTEAHCFNASNLVFCEFELPAEPGAAFSRDDASLIVAQAVRGLPAAHDPFHMAVIVARSVRAVSGFERVIVYRFECDGDGEVVGECLSEDWSQSFMGLRFPASDIPQQARALYLISHARWMPARDYVPIPLSPSRSQSSEAFDLSLSLYRSISPVHTAYQENIGADGAMSLSVFCNGALWGLVIGHHRKPYRVSPATRHHAAAIVQAFGIALEARLTRSAKKAWRTGAAAQSVILSRLAMADECLDALIDGAPSSIDLLPGCTGAALVWNHNGASHVRTLGETPPSADISALALLIRAEAKDPVFSCDCISGRLPLFNSHTEKASGVLSMQFEDARHPLLLLFRPEVIRTVSWAGKPEKAIGPNGSPSLPRRSFELWVEAKRSHAQPWSPGDLETAADFLAAVNLILAQEARRHQFEAAEEAAREAIRTKKDNLKLAAQNQALAAAKKETEASNRELEAFSYSVAHDLRAPLRSINGFCQIIEEDCADQLDGTGRGYLARVRRAAEHMAMLIDDLLRLAQITQGDLTYATVHLSQIAAHIAESLSERASERRADFIIAPGLSVRGDARLLRIVMENLLSNAWKFTAREPAVRIEFGSETAGGQTVLYVRDNGVGFDMAHAGKLFGAFQRLHSVHEFPGSGVGLATVQRIIGKHGGRIWADAAPGEGATFRFIVPEGPGGTGEQDHG